MAFMKSVLTYEIIPPREDTGWGLQKRCVIDTDQTSYAVKGDIVSVSGYNLPPYKGICYEMTGSWRHHAKHGVQFVVKNYQEIIKTENDFISFLSCGIFKGIGKTTAKKIYDKFGDDALQVIDKDPDKLKAILNRNKISELTKSWENNKSSRQVISYLSNYGVDYTKAIAIYMAYKDDAMTYIQKYPYLLYKYMEYLLIEKIAKDNGIRFDDKQRIQAAILTTLLRNEHSGHTAMQYNMFKKSLNTLFQNSKQLYDVPASKKIEVVIQLMIEAQQIVRIVLDNTVLLSRKSTYDCELDIAVRIAASTVQSELYKDMDIQTVIQDICDLNKLPLHPLQYQAVHGALQFKFCIITGGPGTGKTAIINTICKTYTILNPSSKILLLAPTGKAARRISEISESAGHSAQTIHSSLGIRTSMDEPQHNLDADLIIVDEFSMSDVFITSKLLSAAPQAKIVFVGDVDQLPSVGAGAVLQNLIDSNVCTVFRLTKCFRQNGQSLIAANAKKINEGDTTLKLGKDFSWIHKSSPSEIQATAVDIYLQKISKYGFDNVVCLCPVKKTPAGVEELNPRIQDKVNPFKGSSQELKYGKTVFRIGDPVMHLQNDDAANGDIGKVIEISSDNHGKYLVVDYYGDFKVTYRHSDMSKIVLAYCMTVHKSQGNEYLCVINTIGMYCGKLLKRNLLYTAVTRAKTEVINIGDQYAALTAIKTKDSEKRVTLLRQLLVIAHKKFKENIPFESSVSTSYSSNKQK